MSFKKVWHAGEEQIILLWLDIHLGGAIYWKAQNVLHQEVWTCYFTWGFECIVDGFLMDFEQGSGNDISYLHFRKVMLVATSKMVGVGVMLETWKAVSSSLSEGFERIQWVQNSHSRLQKHLGGLIKNTCGMNAVEQQKDIEYFLDSRVAAYADSSVAN